MHHYCYTGQLIIPLAADLPHCLRTKDKARQSSSHTANIGKVTFLMDIIPAEAVYFFPPENVVEDHLPF